MTAEWVDPLVFEHVVPQPLPVRVLLVADVALVRLQVGVAALVPGHGRAGVGAVKFIREIISSKEKTDKTYLNPQTLHM